MVDLAVTAEKVIKAEMETGPSKEVKSTDKQARHDIMTCSVTEYLRHFHIKKLWFFYLRLQTKQEKGWQMQM